MSLYYREDTLFWRDGIFIEKGIGERCQVHGNSSEDNNPFSDGTTQAFRGSCRTLRPGTLKSE